MFWIMLALVGCDPTGEDVGETGGESTAEEICTEQTSCPDLEYINCMPAVPEEYAPYCTSECLDYLKTECGLDVVY